MKVQPVCDWCGKLMHRYPSQIKERNFCSRACHGHFASKSDNPDGYHYRDFSKNSERFTRLNLEWNPTRVTQETRLKIRAARLNTGNGKTYEKFLGRHTHRVVAEIMLGRPLEPGEVVHHKDGDKRNNSPDNLMIFSSQAEHAKWHKIHDKEGDAL